MKIHLDKSGCLSLEKRGVMKKQHCIYDSEGGQCGEWCPAFLVELPKQNPGVKQVMQLHLCKTTYKFYEDEYTDEAGK